MVLKNVALCSVIVLLSLSNIVADSAKNDEKQIKEEVVARQILDNLRCEFKKAQEDKKLRAEKEEPDYEKIDLAKKDIASLYRNIKEARSHEPLENVIKNDDEEKITNDEAMDKLGEVDPEEAEDIVKREFVLIGNNSHFPVFVAIYNDKKGELVRKVVTVQEESRNIVSFDNLVRSLKDIIMNDGDNLVMGLSYGKEQQSFKTSFFKEYWQGIILSLEEVVQFFNCLEKSKLVAMTPVVYGKETFFVVGFPELDELIVFPHGKIDVETEYEDIENNFSEKNDIEHQDQGIVMIDFGVVENENV
jgi:hypothetical protein